MDVELEKARRAEPAWDELRERRVLARVNEARAQARPKRVGRWVLCGAAVAAVALAAVWTATPRGATIEKRAQTEPAPAPAPADDPGRIELVDGSQIELGPDARIEVVAQGAREVRIEQRAGEARYVVSHRPERGFVVRAADVEVRVRGTRFVVRHLEDAVEVEVEEGRVEVARASATSMLTAGETLSVRLDEPEPPVIAPPAPVARRAVPPRAPRRAPSMDALLAEADVARRAGLLDDAADALERAVSTHAADPRAATALFTLGRVERRRGRDSAAAAAFARAYETDPDAVLAEDALAEAAVSWAAAGRAERAREVATRYLTRFPSGEYVERVRGLAE